MKFARIVPVFVSLFFVASIAAMPAVAQDEASTYVTNVANQALSIISDTKNGKEAKQAKLETLFSGSVDIPWVARFVVGRYWRPATDDQKQRYVKEYQSFLLRHYTSRFADYTGGTFKITGSHDDGDGEHTVSMEMQGDNANEPVLVDYRLHNTDGKLKIFDIIVEGVSLITTQRSEFGSVIAAHDLDYLIHQLETKSLPVTPQG